MKIIWLTNMILEDVSKALDMKAVSFGGWISGLYEAFIKIENIELVLVCPKNFEKEIKSGNIICTKERTGNIERTVKYYTVFDKMIFEKKDKDKENLYNDYRKIIADEKPDIVHIWGTEYEHSYIMLQVLKEKGLEKKAVVSIQGLVGYYAKHYKAGLPEKICKEVDRHLKKYKITINKKQQEFFDRGLFEKSVIEDVRFISGRTNWDKGCVNIYNKSAKYFHINEMLRDTFYNNEDVKPDLKKNKPVLFTSQASYPIKGFHVILEALKIIKDRYPQVELKVAGVDIINKEKKDSTAYSLYLKRLIKEYDLEKNIVYTGVLNAEEMKEVYKNSYAYISASSIENSPNSVCEAQILGVPVVASDVGGVSSLIENEKTGLLYPFDEAYILAYDILRIIEDEELRKRISNNSKEEALKRHDRKKIVNDWLEAYKIINI